MKRDCYFRFDDLDQQLILHSLLSCRRFQVFFISLEHYPNAMGWNEEVREAGCFCVRWIDTTRKYWRVTGQRQWKVGSVENQYLLVAIKNGDENSMSSSRQIDNSTDLIVDTLSYDVHREICNSESFFLSSSVWFIGLPEEHYTFEQLSKAKDKGTAFKWMKLRMSKTYQLTI